MTNNIKQIPAPFFLILLTFLQKKYSFDTNSFLNKHHIKQTDLFQNDFTIDINIIKDLLRQILDEKQDYTLLYDLAKLSTPSRLGILGYIMIHSKNIQEALEKLCKYYILIGKRMKPIFDESEEEIKIVIIFNDTNDSIIDFEDYNALIHLFSILHLINQIIPFEIKPKKIHLIQKKPIFHIKDSKIANIKTFFEEDENAIYFDKSIKKIKTICADEKLLKIFEKEAEETLDIKVSGSELKDKVSSLILISSTQLDISQTSIAKKLNLSPRVLQKRLKEENTSFSQILQEVRKKLSIYYLSKDMDLHTISLNLGYIDLSSFFRAFKKWYGITPSEYKNKNLT